MMRGLYLVACALLASVACTNSNTRPPVALRGLVYTSADPQASARWYAEAFHAPVTDAREHRSQLQIAGTELAFERAGPDVTTRAPGALALWQVRDLDASFAHVLALGAQPVTGIAELGDNRAMVILSDPFGQLFALVTIGE